MSADERLLLALLEELEQREARLLTWGLVDGFLSVAEVHAAADRLLDDPHVSAGVSFVSSADVLAAMRARVLLLDVGETPGQRFRSRMAETIRLLFRLRQLFPKHAGALGWASAPTLVADFRFIWRRRRYPRRYVEARRASAVLGEAIADRVAARAAATLIESYGPEFTLADFQVEAARRTLVALEGTGSTGTLVSAGTGSGKTLAFYLPALARIVSHIQRDAGTSRWVKVLALYPRNELLKDQFAEVYAQARRLDAPGRRKILIGTFFGPTPYAVADVEHPENGWRGHPAGRICDYLRCPAPTCGGDLAWPEADRAASRERLVCVDCGRSIENDQIVLTRRRLMTESPDILFTTTEMLNQRLGDDRFRHLFGIGDRAPRPVEMMLLDEVHTYAGSTGAQVAFLLRRWRRLLRHPVCFVGLSATLADGARFFASLTGLNEQACVEVSPRSADMVEEGAEYLLALRGDPVSRTALLSTTIQTAMLLSRMLDAPDSQKSRGIFGERIFLFTDDIDVTNRIYFAMLDAEGRRSNGAVDPVNHPQGGLATLRRAMPSQHRKLHGQDWEAATEVGHSLQAQDRKSVGRVMSMDPGVDSGRDIIVATASLEVGFNDPRVGAVVQHKAPRDVAQFLQRKGRAGRSRLMRPWTVVVLSDYGRDRLAYQGYDLLFDPELPPRMLPTGNRHILRIQAVYATMDFLSQTLRADTPPGSVWTNLAGPPYGQNPVQRQRQLAVAARVRQILSSPAEQERYAAYLREALRIDDAEVELLLWQHPRPLLTQVLPTALRRLESNWSTLSGPASDYHVSNSPLPEFAPANLFSDLNLPEVHIVLPQGFGNRGDVMVMPIAQAMREFAPGRVSRRYGLKHIAERHWLCPPLDPNTRQAVALHPNLVADPLGDWQLQTPDGAVPIPVFRPREIRVQRPPNTVIDTSNARLRWRTQIVARTAGLALDPPQAGPWQSLIAEVRFHTHQGLAPVNVRRMALGSDAEIRHLDGTSTSKDFYFEADGAPAALGFELTVDALCLKLRFPDALWTSLADTSSALARAMRTARFHHEAQRGPYLHAVDNPFAREWLGQLLLATLVNEAMAKFISLEDAAANLAQGIADLDLDRTLLILFQSPVVDDANGQGNQQDRLRQDLAAYLADPQVRQGLADLAAMLWTPVDASWEPWLRERFASTVAAAALSAVLSLCPEIDGSDLVVDIDAGPSEQGDDCAGDARHEIWISELAPGGNGHIEEALRQYAEDPRRFFTLMAAALRDNDLAQSDFQITRFLETVVEGPGDGEIVVATRAFRAARGAEAGHLTLTTLRQTLAEQGFVTFHTFLVALGNRVLRPGSGPDSDAFLLHALRTWNAEEARLGVEVDSRVLAYRLARSGDIDIALGLAGIAAPSVNADQWRFSAIYGLLWPRGPLIRQSGLNLYSPFADLPPAEPLLVGRQLPQADATLDVRDVDWRDRCLQQLAERGAVTLTCPATEAALLAQAFGFLATNPVQSDYLSVFARVQCIRWVKDDLQADVDVAEALQ